VPGSGGPCHSSAGLRRQRKSANPPRAATTTAMTMTGRRLLEGAPPELWCVAALATADRCASGDPWLPVRPVPPDPPEAGAVVVVAPAAEVVVVAGPLPDFALVLTAVLVVAPVTAPVPVFAVVGVTDGAVGAAEGIVVVVAGADGP
jgi:hypothetical protein